MKQNNIYIFYVFITFFLLAILFTTPFLRYPYDIFHHLIVIDDFYMVLSTPPESIVGLWVNNIYTIIPMGGHEEVELSRPRYIWHYFWAYLFYIFDIDSSQMFLRAKIIHVVQTYISLFCIYYFSKVLLRNVFRKIDTLALKWISFWSVIIWVTVYATYSQVTHQVWIMWYSMNYQIALPLFWYMLALTIVLLLEKTSWKIKLFFILQILLLARLILQIHSMEFMYYLMHVAVLGVVFIDKIYLLLKKYFLLFIPLILCIVYMAKHYQPESSPILNYLSIAKLPELYSKIMESGLYLLHGLNRAFASVNELMYFICYFSVFFIFYLLWNRYKKVESNINLRVLIFVLLTSMFALIPLNQFIGGLFGTITHTRLVNRLYYSSSLFVLLPLFIFYIFNNYKLRYINIFIIFSLLSVGIFSKYNNVLHHNYYKNIMSVKNSFSERHVGYNLSPKQIQTIGEKLKLYEKNNLTNKNIMYYAPADIAFVIKYIYKKDVNWEGRFGGMNYKKNYNHKKTNQMYKHILIRTPKGFPTFIPYK